MHVLKNPSPTNPSKTQNPANSGIILTITSFMAWKERPLEELMKSKLIKSWIEVSEHAFVVINDYIDGVGGSVVFVIEALSSDR